MFTKGKFIPFENKVWLATPTQHPEMMKYIQEAYDANWRAKDNRDNHKRGVIADFLGLIICNFV